MLFHTTRTFYVNRRDCPLLLNILCDTPFKEWQTLDSDFECERYRLLA